MIVDHGRLSGYFVSTSILLSLLVAGCGGSNSPSIPTTAFGDVCALPDDSPVAIDGYLYLPDSVFTSFGSSTISLAETSDYPLESEAMLRLDIDSGNGRNQMKDLPEDYELTDLQVVANDGTVVTHGDRVTVQGQVWIHYDGGGCGVQADRIFTEAE